MLLKITLLFVLAALPFMCSGYPRNTRSRYDSCDLSNVECIRNQLAARSRCNKYSVWGSIPNQITRLNFFYESPFFRASHRDQYLRIRGLDKCKVEAFFTNPASNATVLGIECRGIHVEANRFVRKHYPLKEDEYHSYFITVDYDSLFLTMNFPDPDNLDICSLNAYGGLGAPPAITIKANDRETQKFIDSDEYNIMDNKEIYVRELILYRATTMFRYIVNSLLCQYRCEIH